MIQEDEHLHPPDGFRVPASQCDTQYRHVLDCEPLPGIVRGQLLVEVRFQVLLAAMLRKEIINHCYFIRSLILPMYTPLPPSLPYSLTSMFSSSSIRGLPLSVVRELLSSKRALAFNLLITSSSILVYLLDSTANLELTLLEREAASSDSSVEAAAITCSKKTILLR